MQIVYNFDFEPSKGLSDRDRQIEEAIYYEIALGKIIKDCQDKLAKLSPPKELTPEKIKQVKMRVKIIEKTSNVS